jgi:hypothetical protein
VSSAAPPLPPGYTIALSASSIDQLLQFANASTLSLVFGLNAGLGPRGNSMSHAWSDGNARALLTYIRCLIRTHQLLTLNPYCIASKPTLRVISFVRGRDGPFAHVLAGVELSNEPNLFLMNYGHELSPQLLGDDMCRCEV